MIDRLRFLLDRPLDPQAARAVVVLATAILLGFGAVFVLGASRVQPSAAAVPPAVGASTAPRRSVERRPGRALLDPRRPARRRHRRRQDPQDEQGSTAAARAARALRSHRALQHVPYRQGGLGVRLVGAQGGRAVLAVSAPSICRRPPRLAAVPAALPRLRRSYVPRFSAAGGSARWLGAATRVQGERFGARADRGGARRRARRVRRGCGGAERVVARLAVDFRRRFRRRFRPPFPIGRAGRAGDSASQRRSRQRFCRHLRVRSRSGRDSAPRSLRPPADARDLRRRGAPRRSGGSSRASASIASSPRALSLAPLALGAIAIAAALATHRLLATRRTLRSRRAVAIVPADEFDAEPDAVLRFAAQLAASSAGSPAGSTAAPQRDPHPARQRLRAAAGLRAGGPRAGRARRCARRCAASRASRSAPPRRR